MLELRLDHELLEVPDDHRAFVGASAGADPDRRFGGRGRIAVAAISGFGLAGMSSSFGGWPTLLSFVAAVAAAVVVGALSTRLTVERRRDES